MSRIEHIVAQTFHGRKGDVDNGFRYSVDYILLNPESGSGGPSLFSVNGANLMSWKAQDHGGLPKQGRGAVWLRETLTELDLPQPDRILLFTQPRVLGYVFNPVSFWFCFDAGDQLNIVVAEVTNTFGTRHSYICHKPDLSPIGPSDRIRARKRMHVSPFQPCSGEYSFRFDYGPDRVGVWIDYGRERGGLIATLTGHPIPLKNRAILWSLIRRPFGARRVLALIHWQALKLWSKKATFRPAASAGVPDSPVSVSTQEKD